MCCVKYFTKSFLYYQQGNKSLKEMFLFAWYFPCTVFFTSEFTLFIIDFDWKLLKYQRKAFPAVSNFVELNDVINP